MHYSDIIEVGQGMADEELAIIVASRVPEAIKRLEERGVELERENEEHYVLRSCFSHYSRTHMIKGHNEPVVRATKDQIHAWPNITVVDDVTIMDLYIRDGYCVGTYDLVDREMVYVNSKAVVLASGGCSRAFGRSTNPSGVTNNSYSMAYYAGTDLVSMEFMQVGMGFSWPVANVFNGRIWEAKPRLSDREEEDTFKGVLPQNLTPNQMMYEHRKYLPFSSDDDLEYLEVTAQATVRNGHGTQRGGIRANFSRITDKYMNGLKDDCGIHHVWSIARDYLRS